MTAKALNYNQAILLRVSSLDSCALANQLGWEGIDKLMEIYCSSKEGAFLFS